MAPRTALYLRTHLWDEATEFCFQKLRAAWTGEIRIVADMTRPFDVPHGLGVLGHVAEDFRSRGLHLRPDPASAMWFNGDYPLYLMAEKDDADFFLMIEGDCCINRLDLTALVGRLMADGVDFCAPWLAPCQPGDWQRFQTLQRTWFDAELGEGHGLTVFKCFFPLVFLSRRAIAALFRRRVEMGQAKDRGLAAFWPFCESFVPSELARLPEMRLQTLEDLGTRPMQMSYRNPRSPAEVEASPKTMVHPVLGGRRLGGRIVQDLAAELASDPAAHVRRLRQAMQRELDPEARKALHAALLGLLA